MISKLRWGVVFLSAQVLALGVSISSVSAQSCLEEATIGDIQAAYRSGRLSSKELVLKYLARIRNFDKAGPNINSIIEINPEALRIAARQDLERRSGGPRGPLDGIPVILKGNVGTADRMTTNAGSRAIEGVVMPFDAFIASQLRSAGAIILGKGNLDEWAHGGAPGGGYSSAGGQTLNPYNLGRGPAGSSGGPAAAVASNFAVLAIGTDTGGSIRGPSAANSLVGIKPTLGLTSRAGIVPFALSLDVAGPMARTVTDAAIALGAMTGIDPNDPRTYESEGRSYTDYTQFLVRNGLQGARIGVARRFFGGNDEVDAAVFAAIEQMRALGATIIDPVDFPDSTVSALGSTYTTISDTEFKANLNDFLGAIADITPVDTLQKVITFSESPEIVNSAFPVFPGVLSRLRAAEARGPLTDPVYLSALDTATVIKNSILGVMDANQLDALVYPTSRCTASLLPGSVDPNYICRSGPGASNYANVGNFADVSVPVGFAQDGLPINVSFFGRAYSEPSLLKFAYSYEQATLFRRPPTTSVGAFGQCTPLAGIVPK